MKHTLFLLGLCLAAAACVSPEAHRQVVGANSALQAQIAGMSESQKALAADNERLRAEVGDLSKRAADAAWISEQKKKLEGLLARYGTGTKAANEGVELVSTPEGYAFRVAGGVLFSPGQNTLSEQGKRTLTELATSLQTRKIRIDGHTDDTPIQRSQWGTNLRLSVERSMAVADFLTHTAGLRADMVSVAGFGEYRPAVQGADVEHRARGRLQIDGAAGMGRHRIEVPGVEGHALGFPGGGDIVDVALAELGVGQDLVEGDPRQLHRIALPDAHDRTRQPFGIVALDLEQRRLDGARADIDSRRDRHAAVSIAAPLL